MSTTTPGPLDFDRDAFRRRLEGVRERTLALVTPLDWPLLRRQHVPILSPMVWDLGHIGIFEETWLLQRTFGDDWLHAGYERMFDAVENPRPSREALPLPDRGELFGYLAAVRERALGRLLGNGDGGEPTDPRLLAGGFVYELVAEHEEQHQETLLQALQAMGPPYYRPAVRRPLPPAPRSAAADMVEIPAGPFTMGWGRPGFAYDNEKDAHTVELPAFRIDRTPVTNGAWLEFIAAGGYDDRGCWSEAGWAWKTETGAVAPLYWLAPGEPAPDGVEGDAGGAGTDGWRLRRLGRLLPVDPAEPVIHVSHHEAEAYARWAGKRLPSEAEWEKAALWGPDMEPGRDRPRRHPWGDAPAEGRHANLDQLAFGPAPAGAYPDGASAWGVLGMAGDVWEWTASDFHPYPGFAAHPYPEYSQIFFGSDYKVLRGGSWATRAGVARGTCRNWDFPVRRQIFSGLRCAE